MRSGYEKVPCQHSKLGCTHTMLRKDSAAHTAQCWYALGKNHLEEWQGKFASLQEKMETKSSEYDKKMAEYEEKLSKTATLSCGDTLALGDLGHAVEIRATFTPGAALAGMSCEDGLDPRMGRYRAAAIAGGGALTAPAVGCAAIRGGCCGRYVSAGTSFPAIRRWV